jgi:hypothetical protein
MENDKSGVNDKSGNNHGKWRHTHNGKKAVTNNGRMTTSVRDENKNRATVPGMAIKMFVRIGNGRTRRLNWQ